MVWALIGKKHGGVFCRFFISENIAHAELFAGFVSFGIYHKKICWILSEKLIAKRR